jgi:hypothetical protein
MLVGHRERLRYVASRGYRRGPLLHGVLVRRGVPTVAVAAAVGVLWGAAAWAAHEMGGPRIHGAGVLLVVVAGAVGSLLASLI